MLTPLNDNLIIRYPEISNVTESGLVIPESAVKKPQVATVVAVAANQTKVVAGDEILVRQFAGQSFEFDGAELVLIHLNDIVGIIS